jgi:hypothetical protein
VKRKHNSLQVIQFLATDKSKHCPVECTFCLHNCLSSSIFIKTQHEELYPRKATPPKQSTEPSQLTAGFCISTEAGSRSDYRRAVKFSRNHPLCCDLDDELVIAPCRTLPCAVACFGQARHRAVDWARNMPRCRNTLMPDPGAKTEMSAKRGAEYSRGPRWMHGTERSFPRMSSPCIARLLL